METSNQESTAEVGAGGVRSEAPKQKTLWKEIYSLKHFKAGDKSAIPKVVSVLENEAGDIFLSVKDENNKVVLRLDDGEVAQLASVLQGRLLKKIIER